MRIYKTIFLILLYFTVFPVAANTDRFYGLQEGLSNSHVNSIYQDRTGLIWICTDNGLNSFDGVEFKTYYHVLDDTTSLGNNSVLSIYDDTKGNLWVGTTGGLQRLDGAFLVSVYNRFQLCELHYRRQPWEHLAVDQPGRRHLFEGRRA